MNDASQTLDRPSGRRPENLSVRDFASGPLWARRFTWIEAGEIEAAFLKRPYPERGHRGSLAALRDSIARCGVIQPIIARVIDGKLQVVCGYRRLLASQIAGIERVPVLVARLSDVEAAALFSEENAVRRADGGQESAGDDAPRARSFDIDASDEPSDDAPSSIEDLSPISPVARQGMPGPGAPSSSNSSPSARVHAACRDLLSIFERIRSRNPIPHDEVEALCGRIQAGSWIRMGIDVRDVWPPDAAAKIEAGNALQWLTAHSLRVALLACHFAGGLGWSQRSTADLIRAGLLHDVGMLLIPEEEFQFSLPLNRRRREVLSAHTALGQRLVASSWSDAIAQVALDHHERWDGTGYPAGKKQEEISLLSRTVGLLDSYAAMVAQRAYRPALGLREALRSLRESTEVGRFDPETERSFIKVFSGLPIGLCGRLSDGSIVRVQEIRAGAASHRVEVLEAGRQRRCGETLWLPEAALTDLVTEVPPATAAAPERSLESLSESVP